MRIVPMTTAPEMTKTDSCCSVPGRVVMKMDGSGRTNAAEYAGQAGQSQSTRGTRRPRPRYTPGAPWPQPWTAPGAPTVSYAAPVL